MKKIILTWMGMLLVVTAFAMNLSFSDIGDRILLSLKSGNAKEIAKDFSSSVSVTVLQDNGMYNRFQTELILNDFFTKNRPLRVSSVQRITSNREYHYFIYQYVSFDFVFRVFVKSNLTNEGYQITEFRIEPQNGR